MFQSNTELNQYIKKRTHYPNAKPYMKYYIDKNLYELFTYAIIYRNNWEIEFFTLEPNHKKIWNKLSNSQYGYTKLSDFGYDKNFHCYTISIFCPDLLNYLKYVHRFDCKINETDWKKRAKECNWTKQEIEYGYSKYMEQYIKWFEHHANEIIFNELILKDNFNNIRI